MDDRGRVRFSLFLQLFAVVMFLGAVVLPPLFATLVAVFDYPAAYASLVVFAVAGAVALIMALRR